MRVFFKASYPLFGKATKPLSTSYQQRSPYYWWWEFLRRNDDYLACCANDGQGALSALYADFGDVRDSSFKAWWTAGERGAVLFGEQPLPERVQELNSPADWDSAWTNDRVMVVAVPLAISKRRMQGYFAKLLATRHSGKRGRKALSDSEASTARYPMHRSVSIETLRIQLSVYDAVTANKVAVKKKTLAQIGKDLNLVKSAMPLAADDLREAAYKRSVMAATVSRYYKDACCIVANTANGQFPKST
jgi:hypothetical protein